MPEYPDVVVYVEALERFVVGKVLKSCRIQGVSLLKTFEPPLSTLDGRTVCGIRRQGKKIVMDFDDDLHLVVHLMIAGRLRWRKSGAKLSRKVGLAAFDFEHGTLVLTEASSRKRASMWLVDSAGLEQLDPGGLEVLDADLDQFKSALTAKNHTVKRALTDPHILSGIGNAYSDEILHRARMSPFKQTKHMNDDDFLHLFDATRETLLDWAARTRLEVGERFPDKVTAFRDGMATHGRFGEPCPDCDTPIQRIAYADKESNYCPECQTAGKLLADRALSQLLKSDWPKTLEELEARKSLQRGD